MLFKFNQPSLPAIQAKFIVERFTNFTESLGNINIFVTGRTGSGKTTLGNLLSGTDYLMRSSGHQDCTDEINLLKFSIGLNYFDLPGVCSDDRLENYNRAALSLQQVEDFPPVDSLTLVKYLENKSSDKVNFSVNDFSQKLKPDIIFYLIAADKQFLRDDCIYLQDLLKHHSKIIYVLNTFSNKQAIESQSATSQNITDIIGKINKIHISAFGETSQPEIVKTNCWTGEGITELMTSTKQILEPNNAKIFDELINYQNEKAPVEFSYQVKREILRLVAHVACQKPINDSDNFLYDACNKLREFIATVLCKSKKISSCVQDVINAQVNTVFQKCIINHYEKVKQKKSKQIYKSVPIFKTISEKVTDYNNPIKEKREVWVDTSNVLKGMKNLVKYGTYGKKKKVYEVVGYHTKSVTRQVIDRYKEEYSHTEYWEEETGEVKLVGTSYYYFGYSAVSLLLTLAHVMTFNIIDDIEKFQNHYESLYRTISSQVKKLPSFPTEPQEEEILRILETDVDKLFQGAFEIGADKKKKIIH
ncbi:MAG: 50S ribosome-binding GTPase [Calothrix sp. FI2-JRJ7]|jgi:GTPase Era involved in 16S rRNA processing|nr:50S ribosome-binding GTPase [Calothrix sp. FI2-JRJ7]